MLRSSLSRLAHLSLSLAWLSPSLFPPIVTIKVLSLFGLQNSHFWTSAELSTFGWFVLASSDSNHSTSRLDLSFCFIIWIWFCHSVCKSWASLTVCFYAKVTLTKYKSWCDIRVDAMVPYSCNCIGLSRVRALCAKLTQWPFFCCIV